VPFNFDDNTLVETAILTGSESKDDHEQQAPSKWQSFVGGKKFKQFSSKDRVSAVGTGLLEKHLKPESVFTVSLPPIGKGVVEWGWCHYRRGFLVSQGPFLVSVAGLKRRSYSCQRGLRGR
jgi:hypothetical protein